MWASSPFCTETTIGPGGAGLLITTFEMNRSFTTVRNAVTSNRVVRAGPLGADIERGAALGLQIGIALADLRPAARRSVVVKPVSMIASAGMKARPTAKCAAQPCDELAA